MRPQANCHWYVDRIFDQASLAGYTPRMRLAIAFLLAFLSLPDLNPSTPRPKITGIAFMRVYSTDKSASERFYGTTLGLKKLQPANAMQFEVNRHQWIEIASGTPPVPTSRMAAIAFTTSDIHQMASYLAANGLKTIDTSNPGEIAVHDPEDNLVIFVQSGEAGPAVSIAASQAAPSPTATSHHIIHVGFIVRDRAREDAFWRGILGFKPYWHGGMTADRTEWASMQVPDGTDWLEYMLGASATPSLQETGVLDHFSLGTASMNTVLAQLQRNGCEGKDCTAIQMGRDGKIQLNLFDPDRTRIEFMEFRPAIEPCCSPFTGSQPHEEPTEAR